MNRKFALIVDPSCMVVVATAHVPGFFGVCQFWLNCPPVESYRRLVPPVRIVSTGPTGSTSPEAKRHRARDLRVERVGRRHRHLRARDVGR